MAFAKDTVKYRLSPQWRITQQDNNLVISGGADARYLVELDGSSVSFFSQLEQSSEFSRGQLSTYDIPILEELLTAEVVTPIIAKRKTSIIKSIGDAHQLSLPLSGDGETPDLLIVIRKSSTYAELLNNIDYQSIVEAHLFVDMAFHHTLSIGPLVFPGETACIACLQGRISTRWGDETPPRMPKVGANYAGIVSELVSVELERVVKNDTSLTNKTVSWNFQDRTIQENQLLKVPLCPICTKNRIDPSGAIALPWIQQ